MFTNRVLSGMRPTGALHLGHYHGVLKNWVRLQHEYECLFFVADWHALTTHYDTPEIIEQQRLGHGGRLACRRRRSRAGDAVHPVARAGARRAASAAVDDHAARLARARADVQGPAGEADRQGSLDLRLPRLSAAAKRGHPDLPRQPRAGRRGPGAAHRIHPRDRAPLQSRLRPRARIRGEGRSGGEEARRAARASSTGSCARAIRSRATTRRWPRRARCWTKRKT